MARDFAMPDLQHQYQALVRLCQAIGGHAHDLPAFFQQAAAILRDLTRCERVRLISPAADSAGLVAECNESPPRVRPADGGRSPEVSWVIEQRQARVGVLEMYLPLVCGGRVVGVLGLAGKIEEQVKQWERLRLEEVAGLLALAIDHISAHERLAGLQRVQRENVYLRDEVKTERDLRLLTGESQAMKAVRLAIQQVARTDSTVLILGETGTGKELIARAIHQLSPRRDHLLVTVNCAALAPGVIASELFGHEQGAFTGASKRRLGRFELAQGGTIFLDEIGELPADMQMLLLRVLQERRIERVGGNEAIDVDVRVIAATHQDLSAAVPEGRFRADLFFRLNVFPIRVPPLRERRDDIPDLVRHFLHHFGRRMHKPIAQVSPAALQALLDYHWPGNVRELENIIERAMIVTTGDTLEVDPSWFGTASDGRAATTQRPSLAELERRTIVETIAKCRGRIYGPEGAAAALGLKPTTLYGKMRKHRIERTRADDQSPM